MRKYRSGTQEMSYNFNQETRNRGQVSLFLWFLFCGNSRYCLIDALAKHVRERLESRTSCTVFEDSLARVWPVGLVADPKRAERIHAFAKSNGWAATIHETGVRVVFKKLAV